MLSWARKIIQIYLSLPFVGLFLTQIYALDKTATQFDDKQLLILNITDTINRRKLLDQNTNLYCNPLPHTPERSNRWIFLETKPYGLCNQLFLVYGYVPLALLWNVSLIVNGMYSRHTFDLSFENLWKSHEVSMSLLPFSDFFDWSHFSGYWKTNFNLTIVDAFSYTHCISNKWKYQMIHRIFNTWPDNPKHQLAFAGIRQPIPPNTILKFFEGSAYISMYNYNLKDPVDQSLLFAVQQSLVPAETIRLAIEGLLDFLPDTFYAIHI